jgi:hypothetical protein
MTKKTKVVGYQTGGRGSDRWLSPQKPQTGDGKTKRSIFDKVTVVFKKGNR